MVLKMTQWSEKRTNTESVNRDQQIRLPVKPAMTKQTGGNDETVIPGLTGDMKTGTQSKKERVPGIVKSNVHMSPQAGLT